MSDKESQDKSTKDNLKLVSRLKNPVRIKLTDGETVFIAAHGTIPSIASELIDIEKLPAGIHYVEFQV